MKEEKWKINGEVVADLSMHGGMYYTALPKKFVEFHGLQLGDKLRLKVLEAKRIRPDDKEVNKENDEEF